MALATATPVPPRASGFTTIVNAATRPGRELPEGLGPLVFLEPDEGGLVADQQRPLDELAVLGERGEGVGVRHRLELRLEVPRPVRLTGRVEHLLRRDARELRRLLELRLRRRARHDVDLLDRDALLLEPLERVPARRALRVLVDGDHG